VVAREDVVCIDRIRRQGMRVLLTNVSVCTRIPYECLRLKPLTTKGFAQIDSVSIKIGL
jgi:hypothetical protein